MGKAPDEIRDEIEDTRERMTETAEAIRYRADVPTRAKDAVVEKKDSLVDQVGSAVSRVTGKMPNPGDVTSEASNIASTVGVAATAAASHIGDALPDTDQMRGQARHAVSVAQENPIGLAVGSIAVGFLAGMLLPGTRTEDERMGELSDQVKEQARDVGREAVDQSRDLAQEVGQRATEVVREGIKEQGQQIAESARESVDSLTGKENPPSTKPGEDARQSSSAAGPSTGATS
jgi:gas vesicle protein